MRKARRNFYMPRPLLPLEELGLAAVACIDFLNLILMATIAVILLATTATVKKSFSTVCV